MVIQGVNYPSDFEAKKQMIEAGKRLDLKGYVIAGEGSLSVRVGPNAVWITAEGAWKGELKHESFIRVDMNGKQTPGSRQNRLPEDLALHLHVYEQNPALRCVLHAYPPVAVVMSENRTEIPGADLTPSIRKLGAIAISLQNGDEAARQAALVCRTQNGILIRRDGCVMWGETLREAFCRMETLEYYGKISGMLASSAADCSLCKRKNCCGKHGMAEPLSMTENRKWAEPYVVNRRKAELEPIEPVDGLTEIIRPGMPFPAASGGKRPEQHLQATQKNVQSDPAAKPAGMTGKISSAPQTVPASSMVSEQRRSMMDEVVSQSLARLK